MRISSLAERSGVPVATIKYYLREGLLPPGEATSATQAQYGERHLHRLALIRALTDVVGLSVARTRTVLGLVDSSPEDLFAALGRAVAALPPYAEEPGGDHPRARAAIQALGWFYDPHYPAVAQLEHALAAAESVGLPIDEQRLRGYGEHVHAIARIDIDGVPAHDAGAAVEYAVLGTAVYEPVLAALRRLAHQDVSSTALGRPAAPPPAPAQDDADR
ncbi:MerR family transcriptional regulator [Kocuria rosea]|uniref:MerR family transcriptional regulator n=1 Tax=Kocuria rosea TaxID=1275 RepID=UPI00203EA763|nr:MerR family transcriptional regulator [Kocuria rosea]MCM3687001.1 MerR family transcriptional regulator [Kocuria rosea]